MKSLYKQYVELPVQFRRLLEKAEETKLLHTFLTLREFYTWSLDLNTLSKELLEQIEKRYSDLLALYYNNKLV